MKKMKVADYVLNFIVSLGVKDIFGLVGGTVGVLMDRMGEFQKQDLLHFVHVNDERSAAMATEGYSREKGFAVCLVGGGPGVSNLATGVLGAFQDSIPCLFIAGQTDMQSIYRGYGKDKFKEKRQSGTQEAPHVAMLDPMTKYAALVEAPEYIRYHLERAVFMAKTGRPGPVFIDIPKNMQGMEVDADSLVGFNPEEEIREEENLFKGSLLRGQVRELILMINEAKRPVVLIGGGVRGSGTTLEAKVFVELIGAPVVLSWGGLDSFPHDHPAFVGTVGDYATRAGNFAVQNADLIISLGSWLPPRVTTMDYSAFARGARIAMVDISAAELSKENSPSGGRHVDHTIYANLRDFFETFSQLQDCFKYPDISEWQEWVRVEYKEKHPAVMREDEEWDGPLVNPRAFMKILSDVLPPNSKIVGDCGVNNILMMTCFKVKEGQRAFTNCGTGSIGSGLPIAYGLSYAIGKEPVVCILGDGGIQQTIGLLENIAHQKVPLFIVVLNNQEFGLMANTQRKSYGSRYIGTTTEVNGYSAPDLQQVARAFGIKAFRMSCPDEVLPGLRQALSCDGPVLIEVMTPKEFGFLFVNYGDPLEDSRIDVVTPAGIVKKYLSVEDMKRAMKYVSLMSSTLARKE
ncbi:MAG: thiamine pyrophosphate-binding protein [Candidatus Pacebacteria bacterium]|nr:thiamine pyrophosphate-binding protein [Candidatus Paceibacterota bacterium]